MKNSDYYMKTFKAFLSLRDPQHGLTLDSVNKCSDWLNSLTSKELLYFEKAIRKNISSFKNNELVFLIFITHKTKLSFLVDVIKKYIISGHKNLDSDVLVYANSLLNIEFSDEDLDKKKQDSHS